MNKKGLFISFEGPEAVGKSSQIRSLKFYLKKKRIPHLITREPGGSRISEKIRNLILEKKFNITANEEILLLMAGRIDHINNIIKPALKKGKLVITDRFADSTFVYQGYVNNFGLQNSIKLHRLLLNNFLPNLFLGSIPFTLENIACFSFLISFDAEFTIDPCLS